MHLSRNDIVQIHDRLIASYGGMRGILNEGTIDFIVATASRKRDLVEEAAVILELVAQRHPFLDGNKRTGFASAATLLRLDGYEIVADDDDIVAFMLNVAAEKLTHTQVIAWFKDRLKRLN